MIPKKNPFNKVKLSDKLVHIIILLHLPHNYYYCDGCQRCKKGKDRPHPKNNHLLHTLHFTHAVINKTFDHAHTVHILVTLGAA